MSDKLQKMKKNDSKAWQEIADKNAQRTLIERIVVLTIIFLVIVFIVEGLAGFGSVFVALIESLAATLVAFLIFDVAQDKLTKDADNRKIAESVRDAILLDPELLATLSEEATRDGLHNMVSSLIPNERLEEIVLQNMNTYLKTQDDIDKIPAEEIVSAGILSYKGLALL